MQSTLFFLCKGNYAKEVVMKTKIKELRKQRRISQEELAAAVGVTRQTITSIECEKYTASLVLAYKIACYFELSIEDVFDMKGMEI
jgi:putative transcriptional regulator